MSGASPLPAADISLYLHAELLPNIRQITIYISLPSHPALNGLRPDIQLSESRKAVTVSLPSPLDHVTETIKLPARVNEISRRALQSNNITIPKQPTTDHSHDFSFRMQIDPTDPVLVTNDELIDDYVPWTAADMTPTTRIRCRTCAAELLNTTAQRKEASIGESRTDGWLWKDLPSGNWAEMMDFWHCHKPDPHEEDAESEATAAMKIEDQNAQVKGYGASSRVVAIPGSILVDTATFLVAEGDCGGLKKTSKETAENPQATETGILHCYNCNIAIGTEDPSANGWRLLKANVSLAADETSQEIQSHSAEVIIAAQLLELIERESARRFVVHCRQNHGLLLWVFNPDLRYSNVSSTHVVNNQQAMKVLYQKLEDVDTLLNQDIGKPTPLSVEELELPSAMFDALSKALHGSNGILPFAARKFNEWQVGLLSRFSRQDALPLLQ